MAFTFEWLLEDLRKRGMGIQFGKGRKGKEEALSFKKYALEHNEIVHVILDERKVFAVVTDANYQSINKAWVNLGGMKSYTE